MKTSFELLQHEIGKPENVLKRTGATKLDIALLADHVRVQHANFCTDLQAAVQTVRTGVDDLSRDLAAAIKESDNEHRAQIAAVEARIGATEEQAGAAAEKMSGMDEWVRVTDEKMSATAVWMHETDDHSSQHADAIQHRMQSLEERIMPLEMEIVSLGNTVDSIERVQRTINARLLLVMRMSLMMIGVLVTTVVILGLIFFRF